MAGIDVYNLAPQNEVISSLECPICLEIPIPPIFNCINGHIICDNCRDKTKICQICSGEFTNMRNFPLESIVRSTTFRCKYEAAGCRQRILGDGYKEHLALCESRPAECNHTSIKKCTKELVRLPQFIEHLKSVHHFPVTEYNEDSGVLLETTWTPVKAQLWPINIITYKNDWFFQRQVFDGSLLMVWITYFGSDKIAKTFKAVISVWGTADEPLHLSWTTPVHSFRSTMEEIKSSYMYFAVPQGHLEKIAKAADETYKWQMKIVISTKKN